MLWYRYARFILSFTSSISNAIAMQIPLFHFVDRSIIPFHVALCRRWANKTGMLCVRAVAAEHIVRIWPC